MYTPCLAVNVIDYSTSIKNTDNANLCCKGKYNCWLDWIQPYK